MRAPAARGVTSRRSPLVGCTPGFSRPGLTAEAPRAPPGVLVASLRLRPARSSLGPWQVRMSGGPCRLAYGRRAAASASDSPWVCVRVVGRVRRRALVVSSWGVLGEVAGPAPWRALVALSASTPCAGCARSARCSPCAPGKPTYPGRSALCLSAAVGVVAPTPVGRHCAHPPQSAQPVRSLKFLVRLFRPAELRCLFVNSRQERVWSPSRGDFCPLRGMP